MAIFQKSDMEYVKADVPSAYLQGQTHAGIEFVQTGFLGYTHWLSASPYANYNLDWENPCVYYANERADGRPPIIFTPHIANPLQTRPAPFGIYNPFNSDPDIYFDDSLQKMFILNRVCNGLDITYNETYPTDIINVQEILSLTEASEPSVLFSKYETTTREILSPSIIKVNGKYRIYFLESRGGSVNVKNEGIILMESNTLDRNFIDIKKGSIFAAGKIEPWHIDIFTHGDKYYAVVCCTDWTSTEANKPLKLYLAESLNGYDFYIFKTPLIDYNSYRGSAYVRQSDGLFVLYATVVDAEFIQDPPYSVDGREILLCTKDFNNLLSELR